MTPHLAAALGRSLPMLTSLRILKLEGATEQSSEEVVDVKLSFSLDELEKLSLGRFIMRKNFSTFIESLQFSPKLSVLELWELNLDGNDVYSLVESVSRHNPGLITLVLYGNPLGDSVTSILPFIRNLPSLQQLWINQEDCSEEGWRNLLHIQQAKGGRLIAPRNFKFSTHEGTNNSQNINILNIRTLTQCTLQFYEKLIFICKQISADTTTHPRSRPLEQVDGNKRETGNEGDKTW